MAERTPRTVTQPAKIGGVWYRPGTDRDTVHLTDDEAAPYADVFDTKIPPRAVPGSEPQTPLVEVRAAAVARREAEGRPLADVDESQQELERLNFPAAAPQAPETPILTADADASQSALASAGVPGAAPQPPTPVDPITEGQAATDDAVEDEVTTRKASPLYQDRSAKGLRHMTAKPGTGSVKHAGGSWYDVRSADGSTEKVQGKEAAYKAAGLPAPD